MNKYSSANEITSIFIPRVFANITKERITHVVENVVPLGKVERVDIVNIDEKVNRVFIHFNSWYDTEFVKNFKELLNDKTKQAKIVYDEPWYWIVLKNTHRSATGEPKMRLNLDEETTSSTTPTPTPIHSPKSTVTFTTGHSVVTQQKKYGVTRWADYESDEEEGEEKDDCVSNPDSLLPPLLPPVHNTPPPPPYPCPYTDGYIFAHHPYYFTGHPPVPIAPILPMFSVPIAPLLTTIPPLLLRQDCYSPPPLYQGHFPVSSWNGVSMDETLYDEYEMAMNEEIMLTEDDYAKVMAELAQDCEDIYSDEDLYNMEMLEKEELDVIYPSQTADDSDSGIQLDMDKLYPLKVIDVFEMDKSDYELCKTAPRVVDKDMLIASSVRPLSYKSMLMSTSFKNTTISSSSL
jgi:hypothetical protein